MDVEPSVIVLNDGGDGSASVSFFMVVPVSFVVDDDFLCCNFFGWVPSSGNDSLDLRYRDGKCTADACKCLPKLQRWPWTVWIRLVAPVTSWPNSLCDEEVVTKRTQQRWLCWWRFARRERMIVVGCQTNTQRYKVCSGLDHEMEENVTVLRSDWIEWTLFQYCRWKLIDLECPGLNNERGSTNKRHVES